MNYDLESILIAIIIGMIVAILIEFVFKNTSPGLTEQKIQLMSIFLGWILGMAAMFIFEGTFTEFAIIGLAGGVLSPGVYDIIVKGLNLKGNSNK